MGIVATSVVSYVVVLATQEVGVLMKICFPMCQ